MQNADLVLLDEPFSALDAISRYQLQNLAYELLKNKSVLLVTHDPQEALRLSQRIFVLRSPQSNQPALSDVIKPEGKAPRELNQENLWMLQQQLLNELLEGKKMKLSLLKPLFIGIILLCLWLLIGVFGDFPHYIFPSPQAVWLQLTSHSELLWQHTQTTLIEICLGLLLGFLFWIVISPLTLFLT